MRNYYLSNLVIIKIIIDDDDYITAPATKATEEKNRLENLKQQNGQRRVASKKCTKRRIL